MNRRHRVLAIHGASPLQKLRDDLVARRCSTDRKRLNILEHRSQVPGKRVAALNGLPCYRVRERNAPRVKELPCETAVGALSPLPLAIERISDERMVDMPHMDANLVRTAGIEMAFDERVAVIGTASFEALKNLERGDRLARERIVRDRHLHPVARRTGNPRADGALIVRDIAVNERDVAPVE